MHKPPTNHPLIRIDALAIADHRGVLASPGSVLVDRSEGTWAGRVLAVGTPTKVDGHSAAARADVVRMGMPHALLVPGMVNSHTHLDLTHIGPQPHDPGAGFVPWVEMVRASRKINSSEIAASVRRGVELSCAAGVVAIGDIAGAPRGVGSLAPARAMREMGMAGVSYLEFFGIGKNLWSFQSWLMAAVAAGLQEEMHKDGGEPGVRIGVQPHAPNTVDARAYRWVLEYATQLGLPVATHVAETPEERAFVSAGMGPQREMLERLGVWSDAVLDEVGRSRSPVGHIAEIVRNARKSTPRTAFVHLNDVRDEDLEALTSVASEQTRDDGGVTVVYCPRASAYFGSESHFGAHRYREMLRAGVRVVLGTDSVINLPCEAGRMPDEGGGGAGRGMSVWDEMVFLKRRDGTDARQLLGMGTTRAAAAMGLKERAFAFTEGAPICGIAAIEPSQEGAGREWGRDDAILEGAMLGAGRSQLLLK